MELNERLQYCRVCSKRKFSLSIGIVCNMTDAKPAFEQKCEHFVLDQAEAQRVLTRERAAAESEGVQSGFFAPEKKGMKKGVLGGIIMIVIALAWFIGGLAINRIFFYPPVLLIIGIVSVIKGLAEGNYAGEKYKKPAV